MNMFMKILGPYSAVVIFWCIFQNAWGAILFYHLQVLLWNWRSIRVLRKPCDNYFLLLALPAILAGPILYFLLPYISLIPLKLWLESHHLSREGLILLVLYFGVLHPMIEQLHWYELRQKTSLAHFAFAGYHMLVLASLLPLLWLIVSFIVLFLVSIIWNYSYSSSGSLRPAIFSHILADTGVIIVALLTFLIS